MVIAGPTASGKSAQALRLALGQNAVIINADASQVYADLRIISARPGAADEAAVPHRLFGFLDAADSCTAARWAALARAAIATAHGQGQLPILVGGTGLYLRTLLDGIAPVPEIAPELRAEVRALAAAEVRARLETADPAMAARLDANDRQRNARALEVWLATGQSLHWWQQAPRVGGIGHEVALDAMVLAPPRELLQARIDARIDAMWQAGALAEAQALAARALAPDRPILRAIGVPPLLALVRGELDAAAARERWRIDTRRYAKRQQTWFRHQTPGWRRIAAG